MQAPRTFPITFSGASVFRPIQEPAQHCATINLSFMRDETRKWENAQSTVRLNDCSASKR
jgi:hypothetical protein